MKKKTKARSTAKAPTVKTHVIVVHDLTQARIALFDAGRIHDRKVEIALVGGGKIPDPIPNCPPKRDWPVHVSIRKATAEEATTEIRP